jgi:hypothetical protein
MATEKSGPAGPVAPGCIISFSVHEPSLRLLLSYLPCHLELAGHPGDTTSMDYACYFWDC